MLIVKKDQAYRNYQYQSFKLCYIVNENNHILIALPQIIESIQGYIESNYGHVCGPNEIDIHVFRDTKVSYSIFINVIPFERK